MRVNRWVIRASSVSGVLCGLVLVCAVLPGCGLVAGTSKRETDDSLALAVGTIRNSRTLDGPVVGYGADRSSTYAAYEVLRDRASKEYLVELQNDPDFILVVYAFMALDERFPGYDLFPALMKHLKNDATIEQFWGCVLFQSTVGDACFEVLADELTPEQKAQVMHQVLTTKNSLALRGRILTGWQIPSKYLKEIRRMAAAGEDEALVALAKFRRKEDIPLILKRLEGRDDDTPFYALRAISYFPDERFLPHLAKLQKKLLPEKYWSTTQREFYVAVARYKNKQALELLSIPLDPHRDVPMRTYHINFVFKAVASEQWPPYDDLLFRLWEDHGRLNVSVLKRLSRADHGRCLAAVRKALSDIRSLRIYSLGESGNITRPFLHLWMQAKTPDGIDVLKKTVAAANVHEFCSLVESPDFPRAKALIPALFARYESDDNPHIFLAAAKAIMAYDSDDLNTRLRDEAGKRPQLHTGWGGDALKELLQAQKR